MAFCGFPSLLADPPATSAQLADEWRRYVETCIEAFGADRCMFESNYPVDRGAGSYAPCRTPSSAWRPAPRDERTALLSGTAMRVYRVDLSGAR